jgi:hypothetical protein
MRRLREKGKIMVLAKPRRNFSTIGGLSIVHLFTALWGARYFVEFFPKFVDRLQLPDNLKAGDKGDYPDAVRAQSRLARKDR